MPLHEFGLQICLKAHSKDIKTKEDVLTTFVHWRLLRYGFICMGDGPSPNNIPSEVLPLNLGWDGDLRGYFLKYENRRKQYLVSVHVKDGTCEIGLLSDARVTKIGIETDALVRDDQLINLEFSEEIACQIDTDLIMPQGFKRVDEKWLTEWQDRKGLYAQMAAEMNAPQVDPYNDGFPRQVKEDLTITMDKSFQAKQC